VHQGPDRPGKLAGDCHRGDLGELAALHHPPVPPMEPLLGRDTEGQHRRRLIDPAAVAFARGRRPGAVRPGGFDQDPPEMGIAGLW